MTMTTMRTTMTQATPNHTNLDELLKDIDPEDFIGFLGFDTKLATGRSGTQVNVRECPRCGGSDWKVYLNAETGIGCCFHGACADHPGMNLFTFTRALTGSNKAAFAEFERYSRDISWKPREKKEELNVEIGLDETKLELPKSVLLPYKERLPVYLANRGFSKSTVKDFDLRYCESGYFPYKDPAGIRKWQYYGKRILIPVYNLDGELVTFQGRDITGESDKKYLFPPGVAGTGRFIYNGHNARGATEIVVGEGAFDVMAIYEAFSADPILRQIVPVGTFGKVLSEGSVEGNDQLGSLLKLKQEGLIRVTMMWDGELKTTKSALKAAMRLEKMGLEAFVARLPENKDPNEVSSSVVIDAYKNAFRATPVNATKFLAGII